MSPFAMDGVAGATSIERSSGAVTSTAAVPTCPPKLADTVAFPAPVAVTSPVASTVATERSSEDQSASAVRSWSGPLV